MDIVHRPSDERGEWCGPGFKTGFRPWLGSWVEKGLGYVLVFWCCLAIPIANAAESANKLDINRANALELAEALPGIGPVKAQRIVEHREQTGPYGTVDALLDVKGIGPRTLDKLRAHITVGAALELRARTREAEVQAAVRRVIARARDPASSGLPRRADD